jgi:hypothetical protein
MTISHQGPYSQHFIFFVTMSEPNKLECYITLGKTSAKDKHSSLLGPFVSFKENEVLWIQFLDLKKFYGLPGGVTPL